jgi:cytochrome b
VRADPAARPHAGGGGSVAAWDGPTRLFKWSLVALVAAAWTTQHYGLIEWHLRIGYAILVLLVFRLLWGVVGSSTARFAAWVTWPWTAFRYATGLLRGRAPPYLSHNPLGGWMILVLLALVGAQAVTGLFTVDDNGIYGGPFANLDFGDPTPVQSLFGRWHHIAFNVILAFIAIHVVANLTYHFIKKDPVVRAMITGRKPVEPFVDQPAMTPAPALVARALGCLALAVAIVLGGIRLAGGSL